MLLAIAITGLICACLAAGHTQHGKWGGIAIAASTAVMVVGLAFAGVR